MPVTKKGRCYEMKRFYKMIAVLIALCMMLSIGTMNAMAETASVVFLHAPLIVSVKETAHVTATFSESLVFRSCAAEEKNATDNQLHLNRPAQTAYMERRNGPTHDFTLFPEDYRNSRYRRG